MLTEQAQLYSSLGQQRRAIALLCNEVPDQNCQPGSALAIAQQQADGLGTVAALGSLGNAYRLRGNYTAGIDYLNASLKLAQERQLSAYEIAAWHGLGNLHSSLAKRYQRQLQFAQVTGDVLAIQTITQSLNQSLDQAIADLEQSLTLAHQQQDRVNELRALLNLVTLFPYRNTNPETAKARLQQAEELFDRLPDSQEKAFVAIHLATLWQLISTPSALTASDALTRCSQLSSHATAVEPLLHQAIAIAQRIQDSQSAAFALGRLGHLAECQQQYTQALSLTEQAQLAAITAEHRYLWEWQAGRILQATGHLPAAIAAYETAVHTLSTLRADIAIASRDFQFDFRDTVEPIYRQLTALYLSQDQLPIAHHQPEGDTQTRFSEAQIANAPTPIDAALKTIDSLRLAELQNYLGDECSFTIFPKPITLINAQTAVLSSVILDDRVAVILSLPQTQADRTSSLQSQVYWLPASATEVTTTLNQLRLQLEKRSDLADTYLKSAQQVYDWLIRPFQQSLQAASIDTLVFIHDGLFRSIPMAALHDGKQFLVEHYAIASTLSLTLVDPTELHHAALRVLGFGLTEPAIVNDTTIFEALTSVKSEIDSIQTIFPGSRGFVDAAFTTTRLQQELAQGTYPIVHLATHGKFGIDARETYLVTGGKQPNRQHPSQSAARHLYNEKLTINQLYQIMRSMPSSSRVDLLVLTACETAIGSDREALGIAGLALQAGVQSAIASLWQVDDRSTAKLITQFYQELQHENSRAKALQVAQKEWLSQHPNSHPGYWAALILVGNWL
jgi:CHAT domain-containing protein